MNRLRSFDLPHKSIRNALSQLSLLAGNTDYSDKEQVKQLHGLGKDIFMLLSVHANDENDKMLARLEERSPGSSNHDMDDHEKIEAEQAKLEKLLDDILDKSRAGEIPAGEGAEFYFNFSGFHSGYLKHMIGEETDTQKALWDNFTDEELIDMRNKIIANIPPPVYLKWYRFMVPSQSPLERIMVLNALKAMVPEAFFQQLVGVAEKYLQPNEFNALKEGVS